MHAGRVIFSIGFALLVAGGGCSRGGVGEGDPVNLLLVTVDTLRPDRLGCYGNDAARTPAVDRLAARGVLVAGAATRIPATIPSLGALLSSTAPYRLGLYGNKDVLRPGAVTLAEALSAAGYATEAITFGVPSQRRGLEQGFQRYNGAEAGSGEVSPAGFAAAEEALALFERWADEAPAGPFFLWVHFWDPHQDYTPPAEMAALFGADRSGYSRMGQFSRIYREAVELTPAELANSRGLYDAEIAYVDRQVGRMFERLDRAGLAGKTLVVFAADHGEDFYEHHRYVGHGRFLYESALRIPMVLAGPGVPEGRVVEGTVRTIDLAPTVLRLLGLDPPDSFEGRSFAGALDGGEVAPPGKVFSLLEDGSMMVRDGRWKLVVHRQTSTVELYDTVDDPGERNDREATDDSVRAALEEDLRQWARRFAEEASAPRELPREFEERLRALGYID